MSDDDGTAVWHRVRDLRPRLKSQARIHRHRYRGHWWYVLQDKGSTRHFRLGAGAYRLLRTMDGRRTIGQIREAWSAETDAEPPSRGEIIQLLGELHSAGLLQADSVPDSGVAAARQLDERRDRLRKALTSPFVIRLPLLDPDRLLERCLPAARWIFGPAGAWLWLACVAAGMALAASHWEALAGYWSQRALAPYNLALLVVVYPLVKALHELAHGLAVKRWGGEVHETGVMLLVFMPLPYVEASAASAFADKRRRMLVSAAGILTEMLLGALAMVVWANVETGLVRDLAFNVILIGGVSTLLFNGNPLLRFDGYYVLADAIEVPNLAQRSIQYYGYLVQRYLLRVPAAASPVTANGERGWFLGYGAASTVYRLMVLAAIALFVAERFGAAGVLLALLAVGVQVVVPLGRKLGFLLTSPALTRRRGRAVATVAAVIGGLAGMLLFIPVPSWTVAQGVVWLPDDAQVRANADGFVVRLLSREGERVAAGVPLVATADPMLDARVEALEWELKSLDARHGASFNSDPAGAAIVADQRRRVARELADTLAEHDGLTVRSRAAGTFLVPGARHLPGRFVARGNLLGYVTDVASPVVRAVVPQQQAAMVRDRTRSVSVRFADAPGRTVPARVRLALPSGDRRLPSAALGTRGGGPIALDPEDDKGLTSAQDIFTFELTVQQPQQSARVGTRAWVRFEHDPEPIASQLYRAARQLLLKRFQV